MDGSPEDEVLKMKQGAREKDGMDRKFLEGLLAENKRAEDSWIVSEETNAQSAESASGGFDPAMHGFVLLHDFRPPGGFRVYEYRNHRCVNGEHDFYRLNFYLSQDGAFVTIWSGLLEDVIVEAMFRDRGLAPVEYTESLFRGYIENDEQARHILKAMRLDQGFPQILRTDPTRGIVCEARRARAFRPQLHRETRRPGPRAAFRTNRGRPQDPAPLADGQE